MFNAVSIEYALARFFSESPSERGYFFHADVFRGGEPEALAEVLRQVADRLEFRTGTFTYPSRGNGSTEAQMHGCISGLRHMADHVGSLSRRERENYHWEIFGALISGITALVETLEAQERTH